MKQKIVFFYPSKNIGGAQLLFIRLANKFSENNKYNVFVVDYQDGYLKKNINKEVQHIEYDVNKILYLNDAIIIVPLSMLISIKSIIKVDGKSKFLFWAIHYDNLLYILRGRYRLKQIFKTIEFKSILKYLNLVKYFKIRKAFIEELLNKRVFFMDIYNKDKPFYFYDINIKYEEYVPIPVSNNFKIVDSGKMNKMNIAWIGRLVNIKIYSLIYILSKLDKRKEQFTIHIIGSGDAKFILDKYNFLNLKIIYHGDIDSKYLNEFLIKEEIGMVTGMGTSVLDSSMMGLPSLLVDPSYSELSTKYNPKWLYESVGFGIGTEKHTTNHINFNILLDEYLADISNDIGRKCFEYVSKNHSSESVVEKLESYF